MQDPDKSVRSEWNEQQCDLWKWATEDPTASSVLVVRLRQTIWLENGGYEKHPSRQKKTRNTETDYYSRQSLLAGLEKEFKAPPSLNILYNILNISVLFLRY